MTERNSSDFVVKSLDRRFTDKQGMKHVEFFKADELKQPKPNHSGSIRLDINLGIPFPRGKIIEIYGNPGSGKTTLALAVANEVVKSGRKALFIDQERRLSRGLVHTFPALVDSGNFIVAKADSGDNALELAKEWAGLHNDGLIIVDSVDSLVPERIEGKEIGESDVGSLPKLMSDGCRKLKDVCDMTGCTIIFLNQLRSKINAYGDPDTTSGGRALGFYTSQRIQLRDNAKTYQIKDENGNIVGHNVRFYISKNSYSVPFVEGEFPLIYGKGIDTATEIFNVASSLAMLDIEGKMYVIEGVRRHPKTVIDMLRADPDFHQELLEKIQAAFPETFGIDE